MTASPRETLFGRINYERRTPRAGAESAFDLRTMHRLMEMLQHPETAYPIVHIAGTKGKGSTASMIAAILTAAGFRTGLYTSPHLQHLEERFRIGSELISPDQLDQLIVELQPAIEQLDRVAEATSGSHRQDADSRISGPTFFEITTALAFRYFQQQGVDAAVIEVGLGGRLDSTNICTPAVSVITNIGMDHMHLLGDRLELIAREKAGIIKPGIPVVSGETTPEAADVIARIAAERGSPLFQRERDFGVKRNADTWSCLTQIPGAHAAHCYEDLVLGMLGNHQQNNASVAIATCEVLRSLGWQLSEHALRKGLAATHVPGRIELLEAPPKTIVDIAHNVPSLVALIETLNQQIPTGRRTLLMSISREKDLRGMLACLPDHFDRVILTQFRNNPRAAKCDQLRETLLELLQKMPSTRLTAANVQQAESPEAGIAMANSRGSDEWLIVAGSAFLAAETRELLDRLASSPLAAAEDLVASRKGSPL